MIFLALFDVDFSVELKLDVESGFLGVRVPSEGERGGLQVDLARRRRDIRDGYCKVNKVFGSICGG
jgi:hypothetical protein